MSVPIILASQSPARARLLAAAGIAFAQEAAGLDERAAEAPLIEAGALPDDIAVALAAAKAETVSRRHPGALVIGADQTLALDGKRFDKPPTVEAARRQLLALSGKTHMLHAAAACARRGTLVWQMVETAAMTVRPLSPEFIGRYLAAVGEGALASVGAYQIEGPGVQLFERIDGDFFAIQGLPLLSLLKFLRDEGAIAG